MAELSIYAPSAMKGPTAQSVGGGSTDPAAGNEAKEQRPGAHSHSIGQTVGGGSTDPAARNQKTTRPMEGRAAAEKSKMQCDLRAGMWRMTGRCSRSKSGADAGGARLVLLFGTFLNCAR
jgi:hypothetical protein